eukprot:gene5984-7455_t
MDQQQLSENIEAQQRQAEQKREIEERRQHIITQILTHDARERMSRIAMVKPDKARQIEDMLIRSAQTGQISEKVDEQKLISLLEQISGKEKKTTITMKRRTIEDDD